MNIADIAILMIMLISMLIGLARGLVVEVMAILVWAAAVVLAHIFGPNLSILFSSNIEVSSVRIFLGYGLIFIGTLVAGAIVIFFLRKLVKGTGLTGTDRLFGMLFGIVRGVVVVVVLILMLGLTPFPRDPWWQASKTITSFMPIVLRARAWLPEPIARQIRFDAAPIAAALPMTET